MSPLKTFPKSYNSRAPLLPLHSPNTSSLDYYFIRPEDQLTKLKTEHVFAAMRNETPLVVREFAEKTLLGLSLFSSDKPAAMTFTHYDFLASQYSRLGKLTLSRHRYLGLRICGLLSQRGVHK